MYIHGAVLASTEGLEEYICKSSGLWTLVNLTQQLSKCKLSFKGKRCVRASVHFFCRSIRL